MDMSWALAGKWPGWCKSHDRFGGGLYNRLRISCIRWSLTSVPIFNDFLPPALGNAASAQFPGPRFHRRDSNFTQGKACWVYL